MSSKRWGVVLIVLGVVVVGISLLADTIGVGAQPGIFGWKQQLVAGVGVVTLVSGAALLARDRLPRNSG